MVSKTETSQSSPQVTPSKYRGCDDCGKRASVCLCEDCYDNELATLLRESYYQGRQDALMTEDEDV